MVRQLASLVFYARFLTRFSAIGFRRQARAWGSEPWDFSGQTWVVSGASGGIGRAIVRGAVEAGARVVALARSSAKLEVLVAETKRPELVRPMCVDLALMHEVATLPSRIAELGARVDVVVHNVGMLRRDFERTAEGEEMSFATNLLGHFVLTEGLLAAGQLDRGALVISISSGGMYGARLDLRMLATDPPRPWDGVAAYAHHKRCQVELTRFWNRSHPAGPTFQVIHPGWVDTEGVRTALPGFHWALRRVLRSPDQGADTALWLGAVRPPAPVAGIWLDRFLCPEHTFAFTRRSRSSAEDLAALLAERAARATSLP